MFISKLPDIIPSDRLESIVQLLQRSTFVNGHISGGNQQNKRNLELAPEEKAYVEALKLVEASVKESKEFYSTAFPRYMTRPIFSRYEIGMYYKDHVDFPVMNFLERARTLAPIGMNYVRSDLSMTIFLQAPDTYDGGELSFPGTFEHLKVKLPAGSAVLYPTGSPHSVMPVTRGVRLAAVFWIQSMFPIESHRRLLYDANVLRETLERTRPGSEEQQLAEQVFYNSFRALAQV